MNTFVMQRLTSHDDEHGNPNRIVTLYDETGWMVVVVRETKEGVQIALDRAKDELVRRGIVDPSDGYRVIDIGNMEVRPGIIARLIRRDRKAAA